MRTSPTKVRARAWTAAVALLLAAGGSPVLGKGGAPKERVDPKEVVTPGVGAEIDDALRNRHANLWASILVAKGGKVILAKGYGFQDYDKKPMRADSLFELASTSKQFTAAAILRLEQQKKLKTSDPISKYFPQVPKDKKDLTIDHLLHHTGGIDPNLGVPYAWSGTRDQYVPKMMDAPLVSKPGEKFAYSNVGYALLAAIVEVVTRKDFEDYVWAEIFAPAKLVETGFIGDEALVKSDRVTTRKSEQAVQPGDTAAKWFYGWGYRGMGGIVSTTFDLLAWDRALRGEKVLGAEAKKKLYATALEDYACGWKVQKNAEHGNTKVHHSGGVAGYRVQLARWLEDDVMVAILSNDTTDVFAIEQTIVAKVLP